MSDTYHSGQVSPNNAIYRAIHLNHSLIHEVTVLDKQEFPECVHCGDAVRFQMVRQLRDDENTNYPGFHGVLMDRAA